MNKSKEMIKKKKINGKIFKRKHTLENA